MCTQSALTSKSVPRVRQREKLKMKSRQTEFEYKERVELTESGLLFALVQIVYKMVSMFYYVFIRLPLLCSSILLFERE